MTAFSVVAILIGVIILVLGTWRILTHLLSLPCPPGFIFILESRMMENVAGPEAIIKRAGIEPGMTVLDAGCGPGRLSVPLAKYLGPGGKLVALDLQAEMLKRLDQRVAAHGLANIQPIQGGLGDGLLEANSFDRAILVTVLGEIPDQEKALEEVYRALVPGGLLSVTEVLPDPHYQSRKKVSRLGSKAGFKAEITHGSWRSYTINLIKTAR
jgi:ubiquinone/menaquinone biosynthesis C-methylase UbiE